jgi:hypothetical protein
VLLVQDPKKICKTPINDMPEAIKIEVIGAIGTTFST